MLKKLKIIIMEFLSLILKLENLKIHKKYLSYTKVFAKTLIQHAKKDSKIVAITAAMPDGTGLMTSQRISR